MVKEVCVFGYRRDAPLEQAERWYLQEYANTKRKLPHLARYTTYLSLVVSGSEYFQAPAFFRLEELYWSDERHLLAARESEVAKSLELGSIGRKRREFMSDFRSAVMVGEANILHPEKSGSIPSARDEANYLPHIKVLWPFSYTGSVEEGDKWFYDHHSYLTGRSFNLLRYVAYEVGREDQKKYGFLRMSELYWRDVETMMNDLASANGSVVMKDNSFPDGSPRESTENTFMHFPHVVGYPIALK